LAASARRIRQINVDHFELSQTIGETVDLVAQGECGDFHRQVQGIHRLRAVSSIGETFPLHCTAMARQS